MFGWLTEESCDRLKGVYRKRTERACEEGGHFKLSRRGCLAYLGVTNDTWHSPSCTVVKPGEYTTEFMAVFYGSGIATHPVRYGTIPTYRIHGEWPSALELWLSIRDRIRSAFGKG